MKFLIIAIILMSACASPNLRRKLAKERECQCWFSDHEYDVECCPGGAWSNDKK